MIAHGGLIAKHMLHDVGHEKTFGKPEPYQHVEHWTEQSRERCEQVGDGSGPEPERCQDRHLVPRHCSTGDRMIMATVAVSRFRFAVGTGSAFRRRQSPTWCYTRRYRALRVAP